MPQPIRSSKLIYVNFRPGAILKEPNLAAHIPVIEGIWNEIDAHIGLFLASLMEADASTGIAMYLAITNDGAKRAAMEAVCKAKLTPDELLQFQTILKAAGERYKDRNMAAHGAWGIATEYPNKLLWTDIREAILFGTDAMKLMAPEKNDEHFTRMMDYQRTIMLYDERDFVAIEDRMKRELDALSLFTKPFLDRAYGTAIHRMPKPPAATLPVKQAKPDPNGN